MFVLKIFLSLLILQCMSASDRKIAFTVNKARCMSKCIPHWSSHYCWVGWGSSRWDYCENTETPARQFFTSTEINSEKRLCLSECRKDNYKYNWCFTSEDSTQWDYCSPEPNVGYLGNRCMKPCDMYHSSEYQRHYTCPITKNMFWADTYEKCSPNPYDPSTANINIAQIRYRNQINQRNFRDQDQCADVLNVVHEPIERRKRSSQNNFNIRAMVNEYEGILPVQTFALPQRPIVRYTSLVTNDNVVVVFTMRATIQRSTVPCVGECRPDGHPEGTLDRMRELNHQSSTDEIGHMMALSLGGPNVLENLVPQHRVTNRNVGLNTAFPNWYRIERNLRHNLIHNSSIDHIDWWVVNFYDGDLNLLSNRRPLGFGLYYTVHLYDGTTHSSDDCLFDNNL